MSQLNITHMQLFIYINLLKDQRKFYVDNFCYLFFLKGIYLYFYLFLEHRYYLEFNCSLYE